MRKRGSFGYKYQRMRKIFTFITLGLFCTQLIAQQPSNAGFETWASGSPQGWSTSHSCISASTLETQETTIVYQGSSAIKLTGGTVPAPANISYPGFAHYGAAIYDNSQQDFTMYGVSFPQRPDSLQFAYRYTPANSDSASAFCNLFKGSFANIIGLVNLNLGATASYQLVTVPVTYNNAQTPDSLNLTFYSGDLFSPHAGSTLYVDAVKFIYRNGAPSSIETISEGPQIRVYPNPASDLIQVTVHDRLIGHTIRIYNLLGSEMISHNMATGEESINVSALQSGLYLYRIIDKNNKTILSGKFNKQ